MTAVKTFCLRSPETENWLVLSAAEAHALLTVDLDRRIDHDWLVEALDAAQASADVEQRDRCVGFNPADCSWVDLDANAIHDPSITFPLWLIGPSASTSTPGA